jgi:hypothetical protein
MSQDTVTLELPYKWFDYINSKGNSNSLDDIQIGLLETVLEFECVKLSDFSYSHKVTFKTKSHSLTNLIGYKELLCREFVFNYKKPNI